MHKNGKNIIARQQLDTLYHKNGVAYAMTRNCLFNQKTLIGTNSSAVIIEDYMPNIDTKEDLEKVVSKMANDKLMWSYLKK